MMPGAVAYASATCSDKSLMLRGLSYLELLLVVEALNVESVDLLKTLQSVDLGVSADWSKKTGLQRHVRQALSEDRPSLTEVPAAWEYEKYLYTKKPMRESTTAAKSHCSPCSNCI